MPHAHRKPDYAAYVSTWHAHSLSILARETVYGTAEPPATALLARDDAAAAAVGVIVEPCAPLEQCMQACLLSTWAGYPTQTCCSQSHRS